MTNEEIKGETAKYLMATYARVPLAFVKGRGVTLTDADGREYLDFLAGLAVCCLGHSHPALVSAIQQQAGELLHTSNLYLASNQTKLARYLADISFGDKSFFCNSGAEANEGAIKLARRYQEKIMGKPEKKFVLSFTNSFHGRTLATLAATGQTKYHDGFSPLPQGFVQVPFNDIAAVEEAIGTNPAIGAIIAEPIQAEGGVIPASKEFLPALREIADRESIVLIFDEVQTGMGRTGKFFAYEHWNTKPDIMSLAKGLGGGVPIGAVVASDKFAAAFEPGSHASTFGGNHLSSAAAIAVIKTFFNDQVIERAAATGKYIFEKIQALKSPRIKEIRGKGLLIGIVLDAPAGPYVTRMRENGIIIGSAGENVLRITPPLIVSRPQCDQMLDTLDKILAS
ncbi:MAG: aspartate aminotransferase family protein [Candidatus Hydrogenedentota bacterium]